MRVKRQKWFNKSCATLKKECNKLGKLLEHHPFDGQLRLKLFSVKNNYKSLLKKSKEKFKDNILKKLESFHYGNPEKYWQLVGELTDMQSNQTTSNPVSPETWFIYFKGLLGSPQKAYPILDKIPEELRVLESKPRSFNEPNYRISEEEVHAIIKK